MMVLASVYLSVSSSLASTPNIKPVEIWLLFNLAYPFLVILVNVIIQVAVLELHSATFIIFYYRRLRKLREKKEDLV